MKWPKWLNWLRRKDRREQLTGHKVDAQGKGIYDDNCQTCLDGKGYQSSKLEDLPKHGFIHDQDIPTARPEDELRGNPNYAALYAGTVGSGAVMPIPPAPKRTVKAKKKASPSFIPTVRQPDPPPKEEEDDDTPGLLSLLDAFDTSGSSNDDVSSSNDDGFGGFGGGESGGGGASGSW